MAAEPPTKPRKPAAKKATGRRSSTSPALSVEAATKKLITARRRGQHFGPEDDLNAALALCFAKNLDKGDPVTMTAAWHRELRHLVGLLPGEGVKRDRDDHPATPPAQEGADSWLDQLPT